MFILVLTLTLNFYSYDNTPSISITAYSDYDKCVRVANNFLYGPSIDISSMTGIDSVSKTAMCTPIQIYYA